MKLLFDENLSPKLPRLLADRFPGAIHVRDCGLRGAPDEQIWAYARDHGYTIVTKDSDFHQRSLLWGSPPKVVWLGLGNCSRATLVDLLIAHQAAIAGLDKAETASTLIILPTGPSP
jgi:predicted nuclease of predicted toxin-antitoxin system